MSILRDLITNPRAVTFAVAHWIIFLFLIFKGGLGEGWESILLIMIVVADLPAIVPALILWSPTLLYGTETIFLYGVVLTSFFTVTFQWLLIGSGVAEIINPKESKLITLSLKDE